MKVKEIYNQSYLDEKEMEEGMKKKRTHLKDWTEVAYNLYFFKDDEGTVWQLLRTPYKDIPVSVIKSVKA